MLKLNEKDKQTLSTSIDKLNEGLDSVITLYNEAEDDKSIIKYDDEIITLIQKAKEDYGEDEMTKRINAILKEVLSLLPKDK